MRRFRTLISFLFVIAQQITCSSRSSMVRLRAILYPRGPSIAFRKSITSATLCCGGTGTSASVIASADRSIAR